MDLTLKIRRVDYVCMWIFLKIYGIMQAVIKKDLWFF